PPGLGKNSSHLHSDGRGSRWATAQARTAPTDCAYHDLLSPMRSDSCSRANSRLKAQNVSASRTRRILWGPSFCDEISKVPSKKSKQRESCQMAPHHPEWTFLCGTLSSENAVHAGFSRRRAQFSLLRRLGCGAQSIRTLWGLSPLGAVIRTLRGLRVKRPSLSPNLGTAKVPSKKSKQRESCQMAPHHPQWTFLCGTLSSENPVHAGFSRRRAQFSLLRRLGCGGGGIRTHEGLS